jgi:NSS family neurotransmitter:Na+ symporter
MMAQREQWATRIGVIMAVAGSAVGLGNFLRFPGQAAQNGGGAFMIPYFIALLVLGIPLCWAEWTMGRYGGTRGFNSSPGIFSVIWPNPLAKYVGAVALLVPLVIYMYYVVIEAWCLGYAWYYLKGDLMKGTDAAAYQEFFQDFVGEKEDGFLYAGGHGQVFYFILVTFLLNFVLIYRGVTKGIEIFCRYAMPIMALCAIFVLVRVLTLGAPVEGKPDQSVVNGLSFMWTPQMEKLGRAETWLAAAGQIFFSLSVGFGIVINYASYLRKKDDVALSGLTASSVNEFFEVCLGGLITVPAAFVFFGVAAGAFTTFGLGFNALPNVFALMPWGRLFGFLWFLMLFLAAITSSISMLQPVIAFLEEGFGLKRHASVALLGLITTLGGLFVVYYSKDLLALDTLDFWVGNVTIFVLAMFQAVIYGWVFGIQRGHEELHQGAHIRVPWFVQIMLKYITPVYLFVIFIGFCWQSLPSSESKLFTADAQFATGLDNEEVADPLRELFAKNKEDLPEEIRVEPRKGDWRIRDAGGPWLYTVSPANGELQVNKHKAGYIEKISTTPVVRRSVLVIGAVFVLLLVLVYFAGKRWMAEGRLRSDAEYSMRGPLTAIAVVAAVLLLFAAVPPAWAVMTISIGAVLVLCGWCMYRVLTLPPLEEETLKGPLEIDTGDTNDAE